MTAPDPSSAKAPAPLVASKVPNIDPEEKLDHYLTTKVLPSLSPLIASRRGITPEMILKLAMMAASENQEITKCSPVSIALALHKVARRGLIIGETCYLVPLKGKCEVWNDYKGDMQLAMESGLVRLMVPYVVYDTDLFDYELGLDENLSHRPGMKKPAGKEPVITHAWVRITLPRGARPTFHVMTYAECFARMKASKNPKVKDLATCPAWYCKKTVIKDWLNRQSKNAVQQDLLDGDDLDAPVGEVIDVDTGRPVDRETGEVSNG